MILLILYLLLALVVSFMCSIMEAVLLSSPKAFIVSQTKLNNNWAKLFLNYKNEIDKPLAAILSLNTIAHTVGAAGVGAQAVAVFGQTYFGIISAILTILILVITEIIPKTIGANYWRNLAPSISYIIRFSLIITYPLVLLSGFLTRLISGRRKEASVSREEISAMAGIGATEGVFNQKEYKIIENLLKTKDIKVSEIMTPRTVVTSADKDMSLDDFRKKFSDISFSRIPIYSENEENIIGYIMRQAVLEKISEGNTNFSLYDFKREMLVVPETVGLISIWSDMIDKNEHIALVVDEYGGMAGIVSLEDVIENILGSEIVDETDKIIDMQEYAKKKGGSKIISED